MNLITLKQMSEEVSEKYVGHRSVVVPSEKLGFTELCSLRTDKNEYPLAREGSEQFARRCNVPVGFLLKQEDDFRSIILNRCFHDNVEAGSIGSDIRLNINKEGQVTGFDDSKLLKISPLTLIGIINETLPKDKGLTAENVMVARMHTSPTILSFSCYSPLPEFESQVRVGDIINGGIDVHHSITGEFGTQVRCYLRRLSCTNGATTHICEDEKQIRARRLPNGRFDEDDMIRQINRLVSQAWIQLGDKLEAVKELLDKPRVSPTLLRQQRTRFSLNNRVLQAIENAIDLDELGATHTQYDWFNSITRVASHDDSLSLRQQRMLMYMGGELSQQEARMCDKCGSWLGRLN